MLESLKKEGIVAVVRGNSHEEALKYIDASIKGGIRAIEVTYSIPETSELIEIVCDKYEEAIVGAGSVLNKNMAMDAIKAGAKYIVSPGFNQDVNDYCKEMNIPYLPGCMTITEAMYAMEQGNEIIKLFPAEIYGPSFIKAIKAPIPNVQVMPTGGVTVDNVVEWFENGVSCVGVGSPLFKSGNSEEIELLANQFVQKINDYRGSARDDR